MPNKSFISDYNQFEMQITTEMQIKDCGVTETA